jgi:hypothetical protein
VCYIREEVPLPAAVDWDSGNITCLTEPLHRFRIQFETKGVREDMKVGVVCGRHRKGGEGGRRRVHKFGGLQRALQVAAGMYAEHVHHYHCHASVPLCLHALLLPLSRPCPSLYCFPRPVPRPVLCAYMLLLC